MDATTPVSTITPKWITAFVDQGLYLRGWSARIQADLDWLVANGYIDVEWLDDDGNVLLEAVGLH